MRINIFEVLAKTQGINTALEMIARDIDDAYVNWMSDLAKRDAVKYREIQNEINLAVEHMYRARNKIEKELMNDLRNELK